MLPHLGVHDYDSAAGRVGNFEHLIRLAAWLPGADFNFRLAPGLCFSPLHKSFKRRMTAERV